VYPVTKQNEIAKNGWVVILANHPPLNFTPTLYYTGKNLINLVDFLIKTNLKRNAAKKQ
jgi:hypothetical protein